MTKRYDVCYDELAAYIDYHFCREMGENGCCYGANPDHGFSFDEAREMVIDYLKWQLKYYEALTEKEFNRGRSKT